MNKRMSWIPALVLVGLGTTGCNLDFVPPENQMNCAASAWGETSNAQMGVLSIALGSDEIAQSFQVNSQIEIEKVTLRLITVAPANDTLGGLLNFKIEGDMGDAPDGVPIATSTLAVSSISKTLATDYDFSFSKLTLSTKTRYWIRLGATYNPSSTHLVYWLANATNVYPAGRAIYKDHSRGAWADSRIDSARDLIFRLGCQE